MYSLDSTKFVVSTKKKASIYFPIGSYVKLLSAVVAILDFQMLKICTF